MIPRETIEKIFEAARIDEVVGEFVTLKKKSGAYMMGLCPFHNEKTPSFTVTPSKGIYKCFGCGEAGSSVDFIMKHEHQTYPEALRWLAKKYNIEIVEEEQTPEKIIEQNERESLFVACSFAQKHFSENLLNTEEGRAIGLSYFKERGFSSAIIEKFQLGYSFDNRKAFTEAALKAQYKTEHLVKAGLSIQSENGPENSGFDRFYGRVMFPVHNASGRVIAFGGRTLKTDKKTAKYINSPETDIYHKSNVLYGLYFAKKKITEEDNCFLVEGYTDVTSLHQAGIENVVASSGTSLTVEQIRLIRRYTNNITILYDGDSAGIKASFRGIDLILEEGMNVKVLLFPDGEDPDSFSKKVSSEELKTFIRGNSKDFIAFKTDLLFKEAENDPIKKAALIREIVESIGIIPDAIIRSVYVKECSRIMDIEEQTLLNELNKIRRNKFSKKQHVPTEDIPVDLIAVEQKPIEEIGSCEHQERDIIRILICHGSKSISIETPDENGHPETFQVQLAEFICNDLQNDNIVFDNAVYNKIFLSFVKGAEEKIIPQENFFINHEDKEMSKAAVDIISFRYSLADWERHSIPVQTEEMVLHHSALHAIYALKVRKLEKMISDNQMKLKTASSEEDALILIAEQQKLLEAKKYFSKELGRIVLR